MAKEDEAGMMQPEDAARHHFRQMEATSQGMWAASGSAKGEEMDFPLILPERKPCWYTDSNSERPASDFWPLEL